MTMTAQYWGLPDPDTDPALYEDVPTKRLFAWVVDVIIIALLTAIVVPFTLFTAFFFLPVLYAVISFLYRWVSLSRSSATPGMRLMAIELRDRMGERLDAGQSLLHTIGYFVSVAVFPLQLVSIALMLISARRQGLTDHVMGTAALNRVD
jgi:uncharacterized RDD family membrane protein YckC